MRNLQWILLFLIIQLVLSVNVLAQVPQAIKYQAIVRDNSGMVVVNQNVNLKISILSDSLTGQVVYAEIHSVTTNQFGLVNIAIGKGQVESGDFTTIFWGGGDHFIKTEVDITGGTNYVFMGVTQLLSVPYALTAGALILKSPDGGTYEITVDNNGNLVTQCTPEPTQADAGPDQADICDSTTLSANLPQVGDGSWSIINGSGGILSDIYDPFATFYGQPGITYALLWNITNVCGSTDDIVTISFIEVPVADAGSDQLNIPDDSTNLQANTPVSGQGTWTIVSGTGGVLTDLGNPNSIFTGIPGIFYSLAWTIDNGCYIVSDTVIVHFEMTFPDCGIINDARDGKTYRTVLIGNQCWMRDNLNYGTRLDSNVCAGANGVPEKYCYSDLESNCDIYGGLYSWNELTNYMGYNGVQGLCPEGWHIPTIKEWDTLITFIGDEGNALKDVGVGNLPYGFGTNSSGFSALLAGSLTACSGSYKDMGLQARFYTRSSPSGWPTSFWVVANDGMIYGGASTPGHAYSVRCLIDSLPCSPLPDQADAGPDQMNITADSVILAANAPVNGQGLWSVASGHGGSFVDLTDPNTAFYGLADSSYYLVWTISNNCGSTSDTVIISFASQAFVCGNPLVDSRDGKSYNTVEIGGRCWMAENLNVGKRIEGVNDQTDNDTIEKYCYNDIENYCDTMGGLYQWDEMMAYNSVEGGQGICPNGWHVPNDYEWKLLEGNADSQYPVGDPVWDQEGYRGYDAGKNLKSTTTWSTPSGTDLYGFTVLAAGRKISGGGYGVFGTMSIIWTSKEYNTSMGWSRYFNDANDNIRRGYFNKTDGRSVRCIQDCSPMPDQASAGPDQLNVTADSVILSANTPSEGQGLWSVSSGNGGSFTDVSVPNTAFYGLVDSTYHLVWSISNSCSITSDTVIISFASQVFTCGDQLIDTRDGNIYNTVHIGSQCWMAENLAYLPEVYPSDSGSLTSPYYYVYDYQGTDISVARSTGNYHTYGVLYNWPAAMAGEASSDSVPSGVQGVCPTAWHLPSDEEWKILEGEVDSQYGYPDPEWDNAGYRGTDAGDNLKETGTTHWSAPNTGATNSSGFTALPCGRRHSSNGTYDGLGNNAYFWSTSDYGSQSELSRNLSYNYANVGRYGRSNNSGLSVRCLMDSVQSCTPQPDQADAGPDQLGANADSVILTANTPLNGQGLWSIASGNGGSFSDVSNPNSAFYGLADSTYYLVWTISNNCGSTSDTVFISFAPQAFICGNPLIDNRDNKSYNTVEIGGRCWMAENINIGNRIDGINDQTDNVTIEKYCYDDIESYCDTFGGLYQWNEMMNYNFAEGGQGICPNGWHVPTDYEWKLLEGTADSQYPVGDPVWDGEGYRGYDVGKNLKAVNSWITPTGVDLYGFTAQAAGRRRIDGVFSSKGVMNYIWVSKEYDGVTGWCRYFNDLYDSVRRGYFDKLDGRTVRCIQDCSPLPDQASAGPDQLNVTADSVILSANTPSEGQGLWSVSSGNGGSFTDVSVPNTAFYGLVDSTYHLVWSISNSCSITSDTVIISFASQVFTCGDQLIDTRDGNIYNTVHIGSQCWMAENLAYLPAVSPSNVGSSTNVYYYVYDYQGTDVNAAKATVNYQTYGVLYNWPAAMAGEASSNSVPSGVKGVCPPGWHLPSDEEWKILEGEVDSQYDYPDPIWNNNGYRGTDAGGNLKETGTSHWNTPNTGATNSSGFTALAGGIRAYIGSFVHYGYCAIFWISTEYNSINSWRRDLCSDVSTSYRDPFVKEDGRSVRCIKDCSPQPDQADAGPDQLNVTADSVILAANTPVNGQGLWSIASGSNGSFTDVTNPSTSFYGLADSTYYLVWTISNNCGSTSDTVIIGFASLAFPCGNALVDIRDGKSYTTVEIGGRCWMAENINIGNRIDGINDQTDNVTIEKYCYDDIESYCDTFGGLYQWDEVMNYNTTEGGQDICPDGWHVPNDYEWKLLEGTVDSQYPVGDPEWDIVGWRGFDVGKNLKDQFSWDTPGGTDSYGFTALAAGRRAYTVGYGSLGQMTYIWVSNEYDSVSAWSRYLRHDYDNIRKGSFYKTEGRSVRCIMDCTPLPDQADAGSDQLSVAEDSVILSANTPLEGQGVWSVVIGNSRLFTNVNDPNTAFYGLADSTYYLVWSISNNCGSTSDTVIIGFTGQAFTCEDSLVDQRDGKKYATVQIGTQCWMAQNLNVGTVIDNSINQTDNGIIEKYCSTNSVEDSCNVYGGLYQWDEMMHYVTTPGSQGICPDGWSIPTDDDWKILEGTVDSQYGVGDPEWNNTFVFRGYDAGKKLKATAGWISNGNGTDDYGFSAKPISLTSEFIYFWSSTEEDYQNSWIRRFNYDNNGVYRRPSYKTYGDAVRCVKN